MTGRAIPLAEIRDNVSGNVENDHPFGFVIRSFLCRAGTVLTYACGLSCKTPASLGKEVR